MPTIPDLVMSRALPICRWRAAARAATAAMEDRWQGVSKVERAAGGKAGFASPLRNLWMLVVLP